MRIIDYCPHLGGGGIKNGKWIRWIRYLFWQDLAVSEQDRLCLGYRLWTPLQGLWFCGDLLRCWMLVPSKNVIRYRTSISYHHDWILSWSDMPETLLCRMWQWVYTLVDTTNVRLKLCESMRTRRYCNSSAQKRNLIRTQKALNWLVSLEAWEEEEEGLFAFQQYALRPRWIKRPGDLDLWSTFWPWKWCPSHVWRGLSLCQFWSSYASLIWT